MYIECQNERIGLKKEGEKEWIFACLNKHTVAMRLSDL